MTRTTETPRFFNLSGLNVSVFRDQQMKSQGMFRVGGARLMLACAFCLLTLAVARAQTLTYGIGRSPSVEEIRRFDISIGPNGEGLPPGRGTAEQGKAVYAAQCARCHGATGREGPEDVLVGGVGSLTTANPVKTVGSYWPYATTLWDYVNRAMPFDRPGMLSPDDVYAVVAYMLQLNGIVSATDVIDATTLPNIRMPNREGFVPDDRPDVGGRERVYVGAPPKSQVRKQKGPA